MERILVAKDVLLNSKVGGGVITLDTVNELVEGAITILTDKPSFLTVAGVTTELTNASEVQIGVGSGVSSKGVLFSPMLERTGSKIYKKAYVPPVKLVKAVGYNGSTGDLNLPTLVAGEVATMKVIDISKGSIPSARFINVEHIVTGSDTEETIVDSLVSKINNKGSFVTAAKVGGSSPFGISLTATENNIYFEVAVDDIIQDATRSTVTAITYGVGLASQISTIWENFSPELGNTNKIWFASQMFSLNNPSVSSVNYDTYTIIAPNTRSNPITKETPTYEIFVLAIPTSASTITQANLETLLTACFGTIIT